jgi:large subunit ribosomal protein L20
MALASSGKVSRNRHKKVLRLAKGYRSRAKSCFRIAVERVEKGLQYAYKHRRVKKRDFRSLWIQRINAAARENGMVYSQFINGLKLSGLQFDRKVLAELAVSEPESFKEIAKAASSALAKSKVA